MGINSAPHMANIYIHVYEHNYIQQLKLQHKYDDLKRLQYNSTPHMANLYLHVYEHNYIQQLKLQHKYDDLKRLQYIFRYQDDLLVVNNGGLFDSLYKNIYPREMILKRTNISPAVVIACGNIPKTPSHGIFISQLIRFCNMNSSFKHYVSNCHDLFTKLVNQNFDILRLKRNFDIFCGRHFSYWSKFGINVVQYRNDILVI